MNTPTSSTPDRSASPQARRWSAPQVAGAAVLGAALIAGMVAAILLAFGVPARATAPAPATAPPAAVAVPQTPEGAPPAPAHPSVQVPESPHIPPAPPAPPTPPAPPKPSAAVELLQRELGQLNYYEGPVNGLMTSETTQAIGYLQRDAHLPQTGRLDQATAQALQNFLATGNNQMGH